MMKPAKKVPHWPRRMDVVKPEVKTIRFARTAQEGSGSASNYLTGGPALLARQCAAQAPDREWKKERE
jgi:hypothetical protein